MNNIKRISLVLIIVVVVLFFGIGSFSGFQRYFSFETGNIGSDHSIETSVSPEIKKFPFGKNEKGWALCDESNKQPGTWDDLRNYGDGTIEGGCIVPGDLINEDDVIKKELETLLPPQQRLYATSASEIHIGWDQVEGAEGYNISRDGKYIATVNSKTEFVDTDVREGKIYAYQVSSYAQDIYSENSKKLRVKAAPQLQDDSQAPKKPETVGLDNYELVFYDEFNNTSLDINKWNTAFLWGPDVTINNEEQYYVDIHDRDQELGINPFSFDEGKLVISAQKIPDNEKKNYNDKNYTSGLITSYDAFKFTHGYAEARVKVPKGQGLWPAFWLLNAYYREGQKKPEIDIMENLGHETGKAYQTYHFFDPSGKLISTESHVEEYDYSEDLHTFAVKWEPGLIQFYIDGKKTNTIEGEAVANEEMYVLANLAVGGSWPGSPDMSTNFPAQYMIDWIRVYQKDSN